MRTSFNGGMQLPKAHGDLRHHLAPPRRVFRERVPVGAVRLANLCSSVSRRAYAD